MDRAEHAKLLRRAMRQAGMQNGDLATALGKSTRSVTNWISLTDPKMPRETELEALRRLLPGYANGGDGVEASIARSELHAWRKASLIAEYQKHLHEQGREEGLPRPGE